MTLLSAPPSDTPPILNPALSQARTLRRLFFTLYLRGRSSRGIRPKTAPKSVVQKLIVALVIYAAFGTFATVFFGRPVFALAVYLHGLTFVFLSMFVSSSSGEILFNKEEADILLHRPVTPRDLLWSKIRVLIEVSLWLAGALNLAGLIIGIFASDGGALFPLIHAISTILEALFCTSCIVLTYQLCLRWFGRERLDSIMTTAQVIVTVSAVAAGQILPRVILRFNGLGLLRFGQSTWWMALCPPAWFAGLDDAVAGQHARGSWLLAAFGLIATALTVWLAFGKLAHTYEPGMQTLGETVSKTPTPSKRRCTENLAKLPPVKLYSPRTRPS